MPCASKLADLETTLNLNALLIVLQTSFTNKIQPRQVFQKACDVQKLILIWFIGSTLKELVSYYSLILLSPCAQLTRHFFFFLNGGVGGGLSFRWFTFFPSNFSRGINYYCAIIFFGRIFGMCVLSLFPSDFFSSSSLNWTS